MCVLACACMCVCVCICVCVCVCVCLCALCINIRVAHYKALRHACPSTNFPGSYLGRWFVLINNSDALNSGKTERTFLSALNSNLCSNDVILAIILSTISRTRVGYVMCNSNIVQKMHGPVAYTCQYYRKCMTPQMQKYTKKTIVERHQRIYDLHTQFR